MNPANTADLYGVVRRVGRGLKRDVEQMPLAPRISPLNNSRRAADNPIPAPPNNPAGRVGVSVGNTTGAADRRVKVVEGRGRGTFCGLVVNTREDPLAGGANPETASGTRRIDKKKRILVRANFMVADSGAVCQEAKSANQ